jgi:hypothetical protein
MSRQQQRGNSNRSHRNGPERDEMGRFTNEHEGSRGSDRDDNGYSRNERRGNYDDYDQRDRNGGSHRRGPNYGYGSDEEDDRRSGNSRGNERPRDEHGRFVSEEDRGRGGNLEWNEHSNERRSGSQGQHRGKGPKGYRRSDERIEEEVNQALTDDDQLDASSIEVKVEGGDVTLTGTVSSREDKRRAEDCIESISGVNNVENRLRVDRNSDSSSQANSRDEEAEGNRSQESGNKSRNKQTNHANA